MAALKVIISAGGYYFRVALVRSPKEEGDTACEIAKATARGTFGRDIYLVAPMLHVRRPGTARLYPARSRAGGGLMGWRTGDRPP